MPTYEYVCTACGHRVEVVQSMTDEPLKTCGVCGGELRKVFHAAGIVFKGEGFYATDSRSKPGSSGAGAPKKEDSGSRETAKREGSRNDDAAGSSTGSSPPSSGDATPSASGTPASPSRSKKETTS